MNLKNLKDKKVWVGLSGGVDSAVTAHLLKEAGAHVTGVFIKGWYPPGLPCTYKEDRRDAMRVAAHIGIPFITLDASEEYKKSVVEYLIHEYQEGRTPNPDIFCNKDIKFGVWYEEAIKKNIDFLATGHYARTENGCLFKAKDKTKDQSYFLYAVSKSVLRQVVFPLGIFQKSEVRALAKKAGLPVALKKDSQGICFLGSVSIEDLLRTHTSVLPGDALDESGKVIGIHKGAILYTIGERASLTHAPAGPWYVCKKDIEMNTIVVSKKETRPLIENKIYLSKTHFISEVQSNELLSAQYRYHGPVIEGTLAEDNSFFQLKNLLEERLAVGQSLVFYRGEECVGGGIIEFM